MTFVAKKEKIGAFFHGNKNSVFKSEIAAAGCYFWQEEFAYNVYTCHLHVKTKYAIDTENSPQKKGGNSYLRLTLFFAKEPQAIFLTHNDDDCDHL